MTSMVYCGSGTNFYSLGLVNANCIKVYLSVTFELTLRSFSEYPNPSSDRVLLEQFYIYALLSFDNITSALPWSHSVHYIAEGWREVPFLPHQPSSTSSTYVHRTRHPTASQDSHSKAVQCWCAVAMVCWFGSPKSPIGPPGSIWTKRRTQDGMLIAIFPCVIRTRISLLYFLRTFAHPI